MQRRLEPVGGTSDLLIIGGGIYGAWAAWEAASRGLSVVLVEQADFGGATSANSQKIIHGGFRYLQSLDLKRMRESIRERRALFRVAPHLAKLLPCVMPTYRGNPSRSKSILRLALAVNDIVGWDRNAGVRGEDHRIPQGRALSREECLRLLPGIPTEGLTGAALWYDGQLIDSERLTLAIIRSAANAGATVMNYMRVSSLLLEGGRVTGAKAVDRISGETVELRARMVLNTAGPWIEQLLSGLNGHAPAPSFRWLKVVNLVLRTPMAQGVAAALPVRTPGSHIPGLVFITPWQDRTIVGSTYVPLEGRPENARVSEREIADFIGAVNAAYPALQITRQQVERVHIGIMPSEDGASARNPAAGPRRHYQIRDYARTRKLDGLITVLGVKYTTARDVAVKAVDLVFKKLGRIGRPSQSHKTPLFGGNIQSVEALFEHVASDRPWDLSAAVIRELIAAYGTEYAGVVKLIRENLIWAEPVGQQLPVIKAQVIFAVREEMAQTLEDVVFRRTNLGALGYPGAEAIEACADLMSAELGWDEPRRLREIAAVHQTFSRLGWQANAQSPADADRFEPMGA